MVDDKGMPFCPEEYVTEGSPELARVTNMARGGQQADSSNMKGTHLDDLVRDGRKYGVTAGTGEETFELNDACPACGSEDRPEDFGGQCPACGHEPE